MAFKAEMEAKFNNEYRYTVPKKEAPWWWPFQENREELITKPIVPQKPAPPKPEPQTKIDNQKLKSAFELIDTNKDGFISKDQFASLVKTLNRDTPYTDEEIEKMMYIVDENDDGKISFEEFVKTFEY